MLVDIISYHDQATVAIHLSMESTNALKIRLYSRQLTFNEIISLYGQYISRRNLQACYVYFEVFSDYTRADEIPDFYWKHTIIVAIQNISHAFSVDKEFSESTIKVVFSITMLCRSVYLMSNYDYSSNWCKNSI